jgi:hypothetical protein
MSLCRPVSPSDDVVRGSGTGQLYGYLSNFNANGAIYEPYKYVRRNTNYNSPVIGAFPNISSYPSTNTNQFQT